MYKIFCMAKMNFKLLLRNKGYLFVIVIMPLLAILILNNKSNASTVNPPSNPTEINELEKAEDKIIYNSDYKRLQIKVIDCSNSDISDVLLNSLSQYGMFAIYRFQTDSLSDDALAKIVDETTDHDQVGVLLYISPDFEDNLLNGNASEEITFYNTSDDERVPLFKETIERELNSISILAANTSDINSLNALLEEYYNSSPKMNATTIDTSSDSVLNSTQKSQSSRFGYSIAIVTLAFVIGGIIIASSIVTEKQNNMLTRINISNTNTYHYLMSKLAVSLLTTLLQTAIIGVGLTLFVKTDYGISMWSYLFIAFGLGLVFSIFSLCMGVLSDNSLTTIYIGFIVWSITSLLGGLYFSIDTISDWYKSLSLLMPQRWAVKCEELLMTGHTYAFSSFAIVVLAYIIIISTLCAIAVKITKAES